MKLGRAPTMFRTFMIKSFSTLSSALEIGMVKLVLGMMLVAAQLGGPGGALPQVLHPDFKPAGPIKAGRKGQVVDGTLPFTLKLTPVPGVTLEKADLSAPGVDPKAKDHYYAALPTIKVGVTAEKAGKYEIPGKLKYFFCNKADGFCSVQTLDVKVPVQAE